MKNRLLTKLSDPAFPQGNAGDISDDIAVVADTGVGIGEVRREIR